MATREVHMSNKKYPEEFKQEVVKQVTERGYSVADVAQRQGVFNYSIYTWRRELGPTATKPGSDVDGKKEIRRLSQERKRVTEEHDILKMAAAYFANESK